MQTKLPKSVIKTLYIHAMKDDWDEQISIHAFECDISASNPEFIFLGAQDVEITVPQVDIIAAEIKCLKNSRTKLLAETEMKQQRITDRIQSLMCIDNK